MTFEQDISDPDTQEPDTPEPDISEPDTSEPSTIELEIKKQEEIKIKFDNFYYDIKWLTGC